MNFKDLNYFVALAEKRSFSKAAEYCNASQPTISNSINRMERELGASLFNRSTRTLALTPKGEEILAYAKSILVSMSMIKHIAHTDDIINRSINLGITTSISHYLYTQVTNSLEAISEPTIKVHEIKKEEFKIQIDSGKMHCILSACDESYSQYEKILVAEFPYVLAVSKNDIIAKNREVRLEDIKNRVILGVQDSNCLDTSQNRIILKYDLNYKKDMFFYSTEVLKMAIIKKEEIALIPQYAAKKEESIKYIPINNSEANKKIYLIYKGENADKEIFSTLAKKIGQAVFIVQSI